MKTNLSFAARFSPARIGAAADTLEVECSRASAGFEQVAGVSEEVGCGRPAP